jgi:hypothetical protein
MIGSPAAGSGVCGGNGGADLMGQQIFLAHSLDGEQEIMFCG